VNHVTLLTVNDKQLISGAQSLGQAMLHLLNQLTESPHGLSDQIIVSPRPTDLKKLLNDCFKTFCAAALQKEITPTLHVCHEIADSLWIDTLRLQQILSNLLNNATKFTNHGFINLSAHVIANDHFGQLIEFSIADTGHGLFKEQSCHTQTQPSTHIGLLLSRQLIELMNGELIIDSYPDLGSTVSFKLAFKRSVLDPENTTTSMTQQLNTLIIDDHAATGIQVGTQLRALGIESHLCDNTREAIALIKKYSIRRLIIDFNLGDTCGIGFAKQLRDEYHHQLEIYGFTADRLAINQLLDHDNPFDDILIKPATTDHWAQTLFKTEKYQSGLRAASQNNLQIQKIICNELLKQQLETLESLSQISGSNKQSCRKHVHKTLGGSTITQDHSLHQLCAAFLKSDSTSIRSITSELSLSLVRSNRVLKALIDNTIDS
jgi:CheY-like chemotaxis protein